MMRTTIGLTNDRYRHDEWKECAACGLRVDLGDEPFGGCEVATADLLSHRRRVARDDAAEEAKRRVSEHLNRNTFVRPTYEQRAAMVRDEAAHLYREPTVEPERHVWRRAERWTPRLVGL